MKPKRSTSVHLGSPRPLAPRKPPGLDTSIACWRGQDLPAFDSRGRAFPPIGPTDLPIDMILPRLKPLRGGRSLGWRVQPVAVVGNGIESLAGRLGPQPRAGGAFECDRHRPAFWTGGAVDAMRVSSPVREGGRRAFAVGNRSDNVYRRSGMVRGRGLRRYVRWRSPCEKPPGKEGDFIECP